jgi:hypothetical protein
MKKIQCIVLTAMVCLLSAVMVQAQKDRLIAVESVGPIKIGMTVAKARRAAKSLMISRGTRGFEGEVEYTVRNGRLRVMNFIEYTGKITSIEVLDRNYRTADGVSVGMPLKRLEEKYGKLRKIRIGEQDDLEYAAFANHPQGLFLRVAVRGKGKRAGIYRDDSGSTSNFNDGIFLSSIQTYGGEISERDIETVEESGSLNEADSIVYRFGDRSVPPQYHRSYTITVTASKARIIVDSYGKPVAESEVAATRGDLEAVLQAFKDAGIKREERAPQRGCTGGTSESLTLYKGSKELFNEGVSHCGGENTGTLSGDVSAVRAKMSSFFPDFQKLIRKGVPSN